MTPAPGTGLTEARFRVADLQRARRLAGFLGEAVTPEALSVSQFEVPGGFLVTGLYASAAEAEAAGEMLAADVDGAPLTPVEIVAVPDLNWVAVSQAALPPVMQGRFVIHGSHDRHRVAGRAHAIEIEAGEAFGTAHHATTAGCLREIDRLARLGPVASVLDLGCGSAVLAIAAARAWPNARVLASDNDPVATAVAWENARRNRVRRIEVVTASGLAHPRLRRVVPFDLVIANILAEPLMRLAPGLSRAVRPGGRIVLSGLLVGEAACLIARYRAQSFHVERRQEIAGWAALTLRRNGFVRTGSSVRTRAA